MTSTFTDLPLSSIRPAPAFGEEPGGYQRRENPVRVEFMATGWDEALYAPIDVVRGDAREDGTEYVAINGNHRLKARRNLALLTGEVDPHVHVHLHNGGEYTSPEEQARLFRRSNSRIGLRRTTMPLTPTEDFNAGWVGRDPECVDIADILRAHQLDVAPRATEATVAPTALQAIYRKPGGGRWLVEDVLDIICGAWPLASSTRHRGEMLVGLATVILAAKRQKRYGASDQRRFITKLATIPNPDIVLNAVRERAVLYRVAVNTAGAWAIVLRDLIDKDIRLDGEPERSPSDA